jgi:mycofactocin system glycosyltransferase
LVRDFPLKSIRLHTTWEPAFKILSSGQFIPLTKLQAHYPSINPEKIEIFFYDLVRKGFLEQKGNSTLTDHPFISIIIPVRNRPDEIKACLESLLLLDYPADKLEIMVVDDASDDHTPDIVKQFDVHLISLKTNQKAPYCRNLAAGKAKGDILAFIDSDCTADTKWLSDMIRAFLDPGVGAAGGRIDGFFKAGRLDRYEEVNSSLIIGTHIKRSSDANKFFYVPSCNLLVKKDLFLKLGGFNPELVVGEDVDLCWRIQNAGSAVEFRPNGTVFHRHRNRLTSFCKRRFDYGTSEPLLQKLHPDRKKQFYFPAGGLLFWCLVFLSFYISPDLIFSCPAIILADSLIKYIKTARQKLPVEFFQHLKAVVRSHAVLFYHCAGFVSRYYLIFTLLISPVFPKTAIFLICLHLFSGSVDFFIKKPRLSIVDFLFFYTLEQISYQAGVWVGALRHLSFRPIAPSIVFRKTLPG